MTREACSALVPCAFCLVPLLARLDDPMRAVLGVVVVTGLALLTRVSLAAGLQAPSAADLPRQVQAHYSAVRDFTADFIQQYHGGALRQTSSERGAVQVKKPGRMYWTYTSPEKKVFVSDGSKIYSYLNADNVVYVTDMPAGDQVSTAVLFLVGRGDLVRDFQAALPKSQPDGLWQLDLTPTTPQADFTALTITVDRQSFALRGLISTNTDGGTSAFKFSNLRENVGLADNLFVFKMPRGVEVRR